MLVAELGWFPFEWISWLAAVNGMKRTIAQNEFRNPRNVHSNRSEEIVVGAYADEGGRRDGSLELAEDEDG